MAGAITEEVHVAHVKHRQFRLYNVLVILAMAFGSMAMGYSASIIATTCKSTPVSWLQPPADIVYSGPTLISHLL